MLNPYEIMYDAVMDVYRYQETQQDGFDQLEESLVASGVKCRYSISSQNNAASPAPDVSSSNQLFCGLDADIQEGDHLIVTLRNGQKVDLKLGEVHPYSFQYQCRVERNTRF